MEVMALANATGPSPKDLHGLRTSLSLESDEALGELEIVVQHAELLKKDKKTAEYDTYCSFRFSNREKITPIAHGSSPTWNHTVTLTVESLQLELDVSLVRVSMEKKKESKKTLGSGACKVDLYRLKTAKISASGTDAKLHEVEILKKKKVIAKLALHMIFHPLRHAYSVLEDLLIAPGLSLVRGILKHDIKTPVSPEVTDALSTVFEGNAMMMELLANAIAIEVDKVDDLSLLLRDESCSMRLIVNFVINQPATDEYIRTILSPFIAASSFALPPFEISPERLKPGSNPSRNAQNLMDMARIVISTFLATKLPRNVVVICKLLSKAVEKRFPGKTHIALGAILFLRLLCPAIVSPHRHRLALPGGSDEMTPELQRYLILVAKLLQSLANFQNFGEKESYMASLSPFIDVHSNALREFYDKLLRRKVHVPPRLGKKIPENAFVVLDRFLYLYRDFVVEFIDDEAVQGKFTDFVRQQHPPSLSDVKQLIGAAMNR